MQLLTQSRQAFPEEPLVQALEYQVAGDLEAGARAMAWMLQCAGLPGAPDKGELRLLAVVFDWCYPLLSENDRTKVAPRMVRGISAAAAQPGIQSVASAVLAAVALADDWPGSEQTLATVFERTWRKVLLPAVQTGRALDTPADTVAFMEMCLAVRDNLDLDLWRQAPAFFKQFPVFLLLNHYPAPLMAVGRPFRQPAEVSSSKSDPAVQGELSRIAELLTVAYETNSVETQFLQGWITHDIYRLLTASGAPYEFLWMNPYQPGLSYYSAPLELYDELGGKLLARTSWENDATWLGYFHGELQLFADDRRTVVDPALQATPVVLPRLAVMPARGDAAFKVRLTEGEDVYVVGLEAGRTYWVKIDKGRFAPRVAARGGILLLRADAGVETAFELRTADPSAPAPEPKRRK